MMPKKRNWWLYLPLLPLAFFLWLRFNNRWTPQTEEDVLFEAIQYTVSHDIKVQSPVRSCVVSVSLHAKGLQPASERLLKRLTIKLPKVRWSTLSVNNDVLAPMEYPEYRISAMPVFQGLSQSKVEIVRQRGASVGMSAVVVSRSAFSWTNRPWKVAPY